MGSERTPKRRSKFGRPPKPPLEKASEFVGAKMRSTTLHALKRLVVWAGGRKAGASRSSVVVNLIEEAYRRGEALTQRPSLEGQPVCLDPRETERIKTEAVAREERIAFLEERTIGSGPTANNDAMIEREKLIAEALAADLRRRDKLVAELNQKIEKAPFTERIYLAARRDKLLGDRFGGKS